MEEIILKYPELEFEIRNNPKLKVFEYQERRLPLSFMYGPRNEWNSFTNPKPFSFERVQIWPKE